LPLAQNRQCQLRKSKGAPQKQGLAWLGSYQPSLAWPTQQQRRCAKARAVVLIFIRIKIPVVLIFI